MLRHVLVPLDGSKLAERALDAARRVLAADGKLTLMTAVPSSGTGFYVSSSEFIEATDADDESESQAAQVQSYLNHVATNMQLYGLKTTVEVVTGDPADAILDRATTLGVEAVVISNQGHSGLRELLFGSTMQTLLDRTPCLLIVVPNREQIRVEDEEPTVVPDTPIPDTGMTPAA